MNPPGHDPRARRKSKRDADSSNPKNELQEMFQGVPIKKDILHPRNCFFWAITTIILKFQKKQLKFRMLPLAFTLYCKHGFLGFLCQFSKQIYILEQDWVSYIGYGLLRSPMVSFNWVIPKSWLYNGMCKTLPVMSRMCIVCLGFLGLLVAYFV